MTEIDYGHFHTRLEAARAGGTAARWELLRRFQEEWGYVPSGSPALTRPGDLVTASPVPAALREWWDLPFNSFADRPRLYWTEDEWPPTDEYGPLPPGNPFVGADEDQRVCVFMAEYEYGNTWGYPAARAGLPDPPVVVDALDEDGDESWVLQSPSVSEFFLQLAVTRLPAHFGWGAFESRISRPAEAAVREVLRPLGLLPWRELTSRAEYFGGPDTLVCLDPGSGGFMFSAYGRTEDALRGLGARLGRDWADRIHEPEARKGDA
ncbi:hypothetical protein ABZ930_33790 [Streptomyces sp. NPDC046716]|uniref:hypothetical protein n=1 Tax=Streptomyces sp. NPDC046716 TaxID=3157093 RepID=UPI0033CBB6A0